MGTANGAHGNAAAGPFGGGIAASGAAGSGKQGANPATGAPPSEMAGPRFGDSSSTSDSSS